MPVTDSPLRYPGGKTQFAPLVLAILRQNDLFYGHYVEPFAGGAGIAWTLLLNSYVSHVHINDIDPAIHAFWHSVLNKTDELCDRINRTQVTIVEWERQRAVQDARHPSLIELGFSTFFLNRTNRSGIIRGGVIGGLQQNGNYLLDCRFNKVDLIRKIQRIGAHREQVILHKQDAVEFLKNVVAPLPKNTLVNLDPPYYAKGPGLYRNYFTHPDHVALVSAIGKIKQFWMVTYDDAPETRALFNGYRLFSHQLNYTAQKKRIGTELVVVDPRLQIPPAWISESCLAA